MINVLKVKGWINLCDRQVGQRNFLVRCCDYQLMIWVLNEHGRVPVAKQWPLLAWTVTQPTFFLLEVLAKLILQCKSTNGHDMSSAHPRMPMPKGNNLPFLKKKPNSHNAKNLSYSTVFYVYSETSICLHSYSIFPFLRFPEDSSAGDWVQWRHTIISLFDICSSVYFSD